MFRRNKISKTIEIYDVEVPDAKTAAFLLEATLFIIRIIQHGAWETNGVLSSESQNQ